MRPLVRLLADLAQNPRLAETFLNDPDAVLNARNLSGAEKTVLKSRSKESISALFGEAPFGM